MLSDSGLGTEGHARLLREALRCYRKALEIAPDYTEAKRLLSA